jgi:hypothetical protein
MSTTHDPHPMAYAQRPATLDRKRRREREELRVDRVIEREKLQMREKDEIKKLFF